MVKSWYFIIYKILNDLQFCTNHNLWRKNGHNWYYIIQKMMERSILASHVQCFRNVLPTGLPTL